MDKRTRVLAAMNGDPVDHVPVGFWFHFSGEEAKGDACVQAHLKYYRETDLDFLKVMCDGYFVLPIPKIKTVEDIANIKPLPQDHPYITEQLERARAIVEAIGKERCVFYNVFAPFSSLRFALEAQGYKDDQITAFVKEDPLSVMKGLDAIAQTAAYLCEKLITESGVDGIYYPVQSAEETRFTMEEYWDWISPSDLYVLEHANRYSENNILHCCGWAGNMNQLEVWQDYPSKVVNWAVHVEGMDLQEGRFFFDGRTALGGFETHWDAQHHDQGMIYTASKEDLQAYTRNMILDFGKRGLMLGGDCTIDATLPWERIKWIVEAARSL